MSSQCSMVVLTFETVVRAMNINYRQCCLGGGGSCNSETHLLICKENGNNDHVNDPTAQWATGKIWLQLVGSGHGCATHKIRHSASILFLFPCVPAIAESYKYSYTTLWVKKRDLYTFAHNFGRCWRIFTIFPLLNSSRNLQQTDCHIAHHTLDVLLHYLVKW